MIHHEYEDRFASLEARIHDLEEERAIRELLSRYGYAADMGHSEAYVALFTEDGALEVANDPSWLSGLDVLELGTEPETARPPSDDVVVRHEGHAALRRFILDPTNHKAIEGMSLHIMDMNTSIHIDGDSAIAESYNALFVRRDSRIVLFNASVNRWTLAKQEGRWLIKECMRRRPGAPDYDRVLVTSS